MNSRKHALADELFRLFLSYHKQRLGVPVDIDRERQRASFIAAVGDYDKTELARLAADIASDRALKAMTASGDVLSPSERAAFREMVQTATLDGAASLGLIPPPSDSRLARLDTFLTHREAAMHGDPRATLPSSAAALH
jgi:hypothetical protein